MSLVPTVATELESDDGSGDGVFADESSQEGGGRQQGRWPEAEYLPREVVVVVGGDGGSSSTGDGRSVEADEDVEGASGGAPSVVGQYVDISSDEEGDGGAVGRGSGSGGKALRDVEGGYQTSAALIESGENIGEKEEASEGEEALLAEGKRGAGRRLARRLRLRLPSRGDMLIYGGFLLNVSTKGTISCFETIGAQYAMTNFSLSSAEVRRAGGRCQGRWLSIAAWPSASIASGSILSRVLRAG